MLKVEVETRVVVEEDDLVGLEQLFLRSVPNSLIEGRFDGSGVQADKIISRTSTERVREAHDSSEDDEESNKLLITDKFSSLPAISGIIPRRMACVRAASEAINVKGGNSSGYFPVAIYKKHVPTL